MADTSMSPVVTERATSQALQDAEEGSPIVTVITKRLRAAKKRLGKIELIEAKGLNKINKDQEETLKTKPKTVATIEELERLIPLLEAAKEEETKGAVSKAVEKALADERAKTASEVADTQPEANTAAQQPLDQEALSSLLKLLYFSQTFELWRANGSLAKLERDACLSYYKFQAPDQSLPLTEDDLQLVCKLGGLMLMRRTDEPISHDEALQEAVSLATKWLQRSDEPMLSVDGASMEQISAVVDRVTCTTYTTVRPVLSSSVPETQSSVPEVGTGQENSNYVAQQHFQGPPLTPDQHQQGLYPPSQESSFSHYPDPGHDPSYPQGNGYSEAPQYDQGPQHSMQDYGAGHMGHQAHMMGSSMPDGPASQQLHPEPSDPEPYRNYSHNGSIASEGHGNHAQQPDIYTHSQQPQAYASGSLDGSQTKREGSVHSNHEYSEGYSGSLDGSNGAHVRQRGEGGSRGQVYRYMCNTWPKHQAQFAQTQYCEAAKAFRNHFQKVSGEPRGGYRGRGAPRATDFQPSRGEPQAAKGGRGRGESRGRGRGRGEFARGRGDPGRGFRGRGPPRFPEQSQQYNNMD